MSELNIQNPCENCELRNLLNTQEGIGAIAIEGFNMATNKIDSLIECKHPWRLLFRAFESNPDDSQIEIISKVIEVRGKNPTDYGIQKID